MIGYFIYIIILFSSLFSQNTFEDSFITQYEYGKMLYENPRGISCSKCHGADAKGETIVSFTHTKNKKKYNCILRTQDITNITYEKFLQNLDPKLEKPVPTFTNDQVCEKLLFGNTMPTYFLTPQELKSIYFYLTNKDKYE